MLGHLHVIPIPPHTLEWYAFRTIGYQEHAGGIGASEACKFFPELKQWNPVLMAVFHHKVGTELPEDFDNEAMFHGRELEPLFLEWWTCWDGSLDGYVKAYTDFKSGKAQRIREHYKPDAYLINPKYPWLFATPDSTIPAGQCRKNGTVLEVPAPLECKALGFWQEKRAAGVPEDYRYQLNHQMIVMGSDYGELAYGIENKKFRVDVYERDNELCEKILNRTHDFWYDRVLPAREFLKRAEQFKAAGDTPGWEDMMGHIQHLEPEPFGNDEESKWIGRNHLPEDDVMKGGPIEFQLGRQHKGITALASWLAEEKDLLRNRIKLMMRDKRVSRVDFGDYGHLDFDGRNFGNHLKNLKHFDDKVDQTKADLKIEKFQ